ncbi:hypothetical protein DPEC_G00075850 [Dallia pectoralis]|uniref:Uncharacterized protein n=1 Tax=Dallia pectoralis TaxID=75939 RepID=A0ACC2H3G5_DALPE|nr:hypothetical protein DPEC_G00075850 [Dallia pectoralis]
MCRSENMGLFQIQMKGGFSLGDPFIMTPEYLPVTPTTPPLGFAVFESHHHLSKSSERDEEMLVVLFRGSPARCDKH